MDKTTSTGSRTRVRTTPTGSLIGMADGANDAEVQEALQQEHDRIASAARAEQEAARELTIERLLDSPDPVHQAIAHDLRRNGEVLDRTVSCLEALERRQTDSEALADEHARLLLQVAKVTKHSQDVRQVALDALRAVADAALAHAHQNRREIEVLGAEQARLAADYQDLESAIADGQALAAQDPEAMTPTQQQTWMHRYIAWWQRKPIQALIVHAVVVYLVYKTGQWIWKQLQLQAALVDLENEQRNQAQRWWQIDGDIEQLRHEQQELQASAMQTFLEFGRQRLVTADDMDGIIRRLQERIDERPVTQIVNPTRVVREVEVVREAVPPDERQVLDAVGSFLAPEVPRLIAAAREEGGRRGEAAGAQEGSRAGALAGETAGTQASRQAVKGAREAAKVAAAQSARAELRSHPHRYRGPAGRDGRDGRNGKNAKVTVASIRTPKPKPTEPSSRPLTEGDKALLRVAFGRREAADG